MEEKELICIGCPLGCPMKVKMKDRQVISVTGNTCKRGEVYAKNEVINPTRIVTSTVKVSNGKIPMVSVKTISPIPKGKIQECIQQLKGITLEAPVLIGDIVKENIAQTGVNIVVTKNVKFKV